MPGSLITMGLARPRLAFVLLGLYPGDQIQRVVEVSVRFTRSAPAEARFTRSTGGAVRFTRSAPREARF